MMPPMGGFMPGMGMMGMGPGMGMPPGMNMPPGMQGVRGGYTSSDVSERDLVPCRYEYPLFLGHLSFHGCIIVFSFSLSGNSDIIYCS